MYNWALYRDHFAAPDMQQIWSEQSTVSGWLRVEQVLAECQAELGLVSREAAAALSGVTVDDLDFDRLTADMALAGRPIVGLVKQLAEQVGGDYAQQVHYGATTQDIMDTGVMLQIKAGLETINSRLDRIEAGIDVFAAEHGGTRVIARTNGQYAMPITLGQRLQVWQAELQRRRCALTDAARRGLLVQIGGPVGDLAHCGEQGLLLKQALAQTLTLGCTDTHWQNSRDGVAEIITSLGLLCVTVGKIAHNINILSSSDIGELYEAAENGRGASSTMAHKRNQRCSEFAEAVARLGRNEAEKINGASAHEHERSGGAWITEWVIVPQVFLFSSGALLWLERLFDVLEVDAEQVALNLQKHQQQLQS